MTKELENLSLKELQDLKKKKEEELNKIEEVIEFQKKMASPYCYSISSYRQCPKGKCKNLKEVEGVMSKYFTQERIGSGLITSGYSYKVNSDKSEELLSFMFSRQSSNQALQVLAKILMGQVTIKEDSNHLSLFRDIAELLTKDHSVFEYRKTDKIEAAIALLGHLLDEDSKNVIESVTYGGLRLNEYLLKRNGHKFIFLYTA